MNARRTHFAIALLAGAALGLIIAGQVRPAVALLCLATLAQVWSSDLLRAGVTSRETRR